MPGRIYKFGEFELSCASGELHGPSGILRLQGKPLLLLCELLDHPQQLVSREQLRNRMWDSRTVVEYEQGINVAVKKVREALGDSADNPRFIETVAKRGYRFRLPVVPVVSVIPLSTTPASTPAQMPAPAGSPHGPEQTDRPGRYRRWPRFAFGAAILCVVGLDHFEVQIRPREPIRVHSLAVLPLQDISSEPRREYFADGITEEIITSLSQTLSVHVISRASVMGYKGTDKPSAQIARELGVDALVEGNVARSGDRVSLTLQLVNAQDSRRLWSGEYERRLQDMEEIEVTVSQNIATQVDETSARRNVLLTRHHPVDPQVYELCLMGRYYWNKRTVADFAKAEGYFRQAVDRDPNYAPAHAGLADVYALWPSYGTVALAETYARAMASARRAVDLDDTLAEPHATLGFLGLVWSPGGTWNEPELRRALQLNPSYATAHNWYAYQLFFMGRHEEALAESALARELDPLSALFKADAGHFLLATRHYDEAEARLRQAIELAPDFGRPHAIRARLELETGHIPEAVAEARKALALDPHNPRTLGEVGYVFALTGSTAQAKELLREIEQLVKQGSSLGTFAALIELGLGQKERTLATLDEMAQLDANSVQGLRQWRAFDELHLQARYPPQLVSQVR
jgi:TolB-like protein/DNA-binding winged helix-turn-helix (wHTH) protein/Tfp pilus assembly protein PilF